MMSLQHRHSIRYWMTEEWMGQTGWECEARVDELEQCGLRRCFEAKLHRGVIRGFWSRWGVFVGGVGETRLCGWIGIIVFGSWSTVYLVGVIGNGVVSWCESAGYGDRDDDGDRRCYMVEDIGGETRNIRIVIRTGFDSDYLAMIETLMCEGYEDVIMGVLQNNMDVLGMTSGGLGATETGMKSHSIGVEWGDMDNFIYGSVLSGMGYRERFMDGHRAGQRMCRSHGIQQRLGRTDRHRSRDGVMTDSILTEWVQVRSILHECRCGGFRICLKVIDCVVVNLVDSSNGLKAFSADPSTQGGLTTQFLAQFFPPGRTTKLRNDILMFQQHHGESLSEAWTRYRTIPK
ncbi:zinc finger, CCHC-type containing protein [Tanacetum coccineum]|uniref:Zinc finger, CCHC-type containing protein n=1 Tax=Tanacetum coccineum TaxID=301880 RepID=A0ABQ5F9C0_9ASTR